MGSFERNILLDLKKNYKKKEIKEPKLFLLVNQELKKALFNI